MAGQNITIAGAVFNTVPSIEVPISGGGTASYVEISDTTATAADVAAGKYFYAADGTLTEGTASGGGTVDALWTNSNPSSNFAAGTINLSEDMTDYDFLLIDYIFSTSNQDHSTLLVPVELIYNTTNSFSLRINASSYNRTGARNFTNSWTLGTPKRQIRFEGASYNTSSNNGYAIPYKIYGIKL